MEFIPCYKFCFRLLKLFSASLGVAAVSVPGKACQLFQDLLSYPNYLFPSSPFVICGF